MTTVALKDVTKVFPDGTVAVDNVSLDVADGEFMVLLGPSGCGKSTVLRMVAGSGGSDQRAPSCSTASSPTSCRRATARIAMVFQDFALYPHMTVGDNIGFPLRLSGVEPSPRGERVADVASALGIGDVLGRKPSQLSGGQRQRVAMGRAIVRRPGLFLMDEPLSNLDSGLRAELRAEISGLVRELGVSTIYVTHDQAEALTMADRVAIMRKGVLQDVGTPTQVYGRPATLYVAAFLGSPRMNLLEASVYVHLDRYVAAQPRRAVALPAVERHPGPRRLALPRRAHRHRRAGRGADPGRAGHPGRRAARAHPLPGAPRARVARLRRHRRHRGRRRRHRRRRSPSRTSNGAPAAPLRPRHQRLNGRGDAARQRRRRRAAGSGARRACCATRAATTGARRSWRCGWRRTRRCRPGHPLAISVRMDALHFFDDRGDRIDVGWR